MFFDPSQIETLVKAKITESELNNFLLTNLEVVPLLYR